MPFKKTAANRHKFKKTRYRVNNWREYDKALKNRGSITFWFSKEAIEAWTPEIEHRKRGAQPKYSDIAIETCLIIRTVFHLPFRQTEGFVGSLMQLMHLDLDVPDHSTLSRGGKKITVSLSATKRGQAIDVLIDSTGLKVYGEGEWLEHKHGVRKRRTWRKLHLALDAETGEIVAEDLTANDVGDATPVPDLLSQIEDTIASLTGDGSYDTEGIYGLLEHLQPGNPIRGIMSPRKDAVPSKHADTSPTPRDKHIQAIKEKGRIAWQNESGYNKRCLAETAMFRYKTIIGRTLRNRSLETQKTEARIGCKALNKMTQLGMPESYRVS